MNFFIICTFILLLLASFFVISSKSPIHSVLSLISVFLLSAIVLIYLEAEFLALSFVVIYVGAIAILFLFIVMMLDIKIDNNKLTFLTYGPLMYFVSFVFLLEVTLPLIATTHPLELFENIGTNYVYTNWLQSIDSFSNIQLIGQVLYTYYFIYFLIAGFILFIAVIGSLMLTLTLNDRTFKKQIVYKQLSRKAENAFLVYKKK